jgi:RNA 3'-terminal phosphate cyclase (GTP)
MILVDGSYLEGGGQIIRTSIALSAITGKPCRITSIRSGRKNPGLQAQHLKGIEAAAKLCDAETKGVEIGSQTVEFFPKKIKGGKFSIDVGTAGSITLVLQTLVPICLFAESESELDITGGTDVMWSPSINYFKNIFLNSLELFGMKRAEDFDLEILRYGFYPKGGGRIKFKIRPFRNFKKMELVARGKFERIDAISVASEELRGSKVAERQIIGLEKILSNLDKKDALYDKSLSIGSSIHAHAHFDNCKLGASALGEIGIKAENVGEGCANLLEEQMDSDACFDEWMADQILPYMAFAGESKVSVTDVTDHCLTNIWAIEKFLPVKFEISDRIISCSTLR